MIRAAVAVLLLVAQTGCIGTVIDTAAKVVTAPIRIVGAGIDTVVPGQHERDRRRGKRARMDEERARKEAKRVAKAAKAAN